MNTTVFINTSLKMLNYEWTMKSIIEWNHIFKFHYFKNKVLINKLQKGGIVKLKFLSRFILKFYS